MSTNNLNGLHAGKVLQVQDDPEGEFRVLITIPSIKKTKAGIWAAIACLDAGANRGSFFRPEIDDDIIVGFINQDISTPVILGSLNSKSKPPAITSQDANNEKGFITRSKMHFIFDDAKKTIVIDTPAGNSILIDEGNMLIEIKDQNQNNITMDSSGIKVESPMNIEIKAGNNLNLSAGSSLSINGASLSIKADADVTIQGASAKLSSQSTTEITGELIKIN